MLPGFPVPAALTRTPFFFSTYELNEISKTSNKNPVAGVRFAMVVTVFIAIKISRKNGK
jgi:hypothetical protein